jgi:hypothetical protein
VANPFSPPFIGVSNSLAFSSFHPKRAHLFATPCTIQAVGLARGSMMLFVKTSLSLPGALDHTLTTIDIEREGDEALNGQPIIKACQTFTGG